MKALEAVDDAMGARARSWSLRLSKRSWCNEVHTDEMNDKVMVVVVVVTAERGKLKGGRPAVEPAPDGTQARACRWSTTP